ncbi:MAG: FAD-dependent oxidoreductase [Candidatus Pacebacteria bacterium]|nr:FAD-dependent oxidoreductase [Candidatus Paceibacterota bacterium]
MYDLIILGGGPAGVAAGIYAGRKAIKTLLITDSFGGQSINSDNIENIIGFRAISGIDWAKQLEEHMRMQSAVVIKDGTRVTHIEKKEENVFEVTDATGQTYQSKTVLYALGSSYRRLNVPGEKEYEGKGVFYCSICDAPLMKGKQVVVIGGGNSGLEAAQDLLAYATSITILEYADACKGDPLYQEQLKKDPRVTIVTNARVKEIKGKMFVTQVVYEDTKNKSEQTLDVSGVFVSIGYHPNTQIIKDLATLDERQRIVIDHKTGKTSLEGIWAAGDVTDGLYNQINTAMGDGVKAVLNIYDYLRGIETK